MLAKGTLKQNDFECQLNCGVKRLIECALENIQIFKWKYGFLRGNVIPLLMKSNTKQEVKNCVGE